MTRILLFLLAIYQHTLSPDHGYGRFLFPGAGCRFHPTCSQYMRTALERYGAARGVALGAKRVLRCHPFTRGGYDPVPERHG